jgi:predicted exporter
MSSNQRFLPLALWLAAMLACVLVILQTHFVADLSAFMPRTPNARQQLLIEQLRDGAVARLIMVGIEGSTAPERARLSRSLSKELMQTGLFVSIQNGQAETQEQDRAYFFDNRYLLSPAVTPANFSANGLHRAISDSIETLSGGAGMTLKSLFARDPTGETLHLLEQFSGLTQPQDLEGAWASRDGKRALLLAFTRAAGSDTEAQAKAVGSIRSIFADLTQRAPETRLVMSGAGVSSVASRSTIQDEVGRLATASFVLVVCLLLLVYRSPTLLLLGLLPVLSGVAAGIAAVSLGFGQVHGLTLGFGTTLIGEAVDYSIYFFIQRSAASVPGSFWRTIWLGVLTSIAGFAALLCSSFPGLAQLGLYSISGLVAAVLVTRYVLPVLTPRQLALRDLSAIARVLDHAINRAALLRWPVAALALAACASVLLHHGSIWNRSLSGLNPIPQAERQVDEELRGDLGGTDTRYIMALSAPTQEAALQMAERATAVLQDLVTQQVLAGFSSPATVLPSVALQQARQAALPDEAQAHARLQQALQGLPLRAERLQAFLSDLQTARHHPPLQRKDLDGTSAALMVDSMLVPRGKDYLVLMPLRALSQGPLADNIPLDVVHAALRAKGLNDAVVIDMLEESSSLFDGYRHEALWLSGLGCLFILALLLLWLRSGLRTLRVAAPLACAVMCVTAALLLAGIQLTILHLVGLLLVVAVGSNYALFFDRGAQTGDAFYRQQTQISLVVANLTSVGSFGLLGLSKVPVLAAVGSTVAPGAFLALVFAAILTRERTDAHPH